MDPRLTPSNERVAHVSLKDKAPGKTMVEGEICQIASDVTDLCRSPNGPRDRQLVRGEAFRSLDLENGWLFGMAVRDGYVGWLDAAAAAPMCAAPTHIVTAARTYAKSTSGLKTKGGISPVSFGSLLSVTGTADGWAEVDWAQASLPSKRYVPATHLSPLPFASDDPASIATLYIGTSYLWGGNSSFGIDCSGLIQSALLNSGIPCPGDSDMQFNAFPAIDRGDLQRGDLVFWKGHVGMMLDGSRLIHANAHHMAVAIEPLEEAIDRIGKKEFGEVIGYARP